MQFKSIQALPAPAQHVSPSSSSVLRAKVEPLARDAKCFEGRWQGSQQEFDIHSAALVSRQRRARDGELAQFGERVKEGEALDDGRMDLQYMEPLRATDK